MLSTIFRTTSYLTDLLNTVVHEVGHTVVLLPWGTHLSIRVNSDRSGAAHGSNSVFGDTFLGAPVRMMNLFAGYAAPVLFGLFLMVMPWMPEVTFSGWWLVTAVLWLVAAVLTTIGVHTLTMLVLYASWLSTLLGALNLPNPINITTVTGTELTHGALIYVGIVIVLSIRSVFTVIATALWFTAVWGLSLPLSNPDTLILGAVLLTVFGAALLLSGVFAIIEVAGLLKDGETDFNILSAEFGGSSSGWFVFFLIVLTAALACAVLFALSSLLPA